MLTWSISGNWLVWWKSHAFWEDAILRMWLDRMALATTQVWEGATKPPAFKTRTKTVIQARQKTQTLHLRETKETVYKTGIILIISVPLWGTNGTSGQARFFVQLCFQVTRSHRGAWTREWWPSSSQAPAGHQSRELRVPVPWHWRDVQSR